MKTETKIFAYKPNDIVLHRNGKMYLVISVQINLYKNEMYVIDYFLNRWKGRTNEDEIVKKVNE